MAKLVSAAHSAVVLAAIVLAAAGAAAQDDDGGPTVADHDRIEEMVVVGTRRRERSSARSPVPVDVISAQQLRSQGDGDMLDVVASHVPSYNVGREPISDAATLLRPANLRGMPASKRVRRGCTTDTGWTRSCRRSGPAAGRTGVPA